MTAWAGCVIDEPAYIDGGLVTFHFRATNHSTTATFDTAGYHTYAQVSDIELQPATRYTVWATCVATNGTAVESNRVEVETEAPKASETWLELPALRSDNAYPDAAEYKISAGGSRNYTTYYDRSRYTSLWVAYPLNSSHMGSLARPNSWSYNPQLSTSDQVDLRNHSYNDNYSRGHLIPNASRNGNAEMQSQTFYVTNSVPQIQDNFNGGIWQQLEVGLQKEAQSETIYIVTGVAFEKVGETKSIGYTTAKDDTKRVPVPNYFYKAALKVTTNSSGTVIAASTVGFWFEHKTYSTNAYANYAVSVDQIEQWTGFDLFPNLPDNIETTAETNSSWSAFQNF